MASRIDELGHNSVGIGSIVHYVLTNDYGDIVHRPAIVVGVVDAMQGIVDIVLFLDGDYDFLQNTDGNVALVAWCTKVKHSTSMGSNTWHWREAS